MRYITLSKTPTTCPPGQPDDDVNLKDRSPGKIPSSRIISEDISKQITHPDIFRRICLFASAQTLSRLLSTSKAIFDIVSPFLYKDLSPASSSLTSLLSTPANLSSKQSSLFSKTYLLSLTRSLTLPLHPNSTCVNLSDPLIPLPNLHTLKLSLDQASPLGWTFCEPDRRVYPYYPITFPCPLLHSHRPRQVIISNMRHFHSVSPLIGSTGIWENVEEVLLEFESATPIRLSHYSGCFLSQLPEGVEKVRLKTLDGLPARYLADEAGRMDRLVCLGENKWVEEESDGEVEICLIRKKVSSADEAAIP